MLIDERDLRFDFGGAEFDLSKKEDRKFLGWVFNQFLYGEVTGIQCGHWLYRAPHLNAAAFLAKQAGEEISHVRRVRRILSLLGEDPAPAHGAVRFLSTGMMGGSWGEHVALEMALGEGLVLEVFYAMADTIPHPEIRKILTTAAIEEQRHVEFGERETQTWLSANPRAKKSVLAQALVQSIALRWLKSFVIKKLAKQNPRHPVLSQFDRFYDHALKMFDLRIERLGLSSKPLEKMSFSEKTMLLCLLPMRRVWLKLTSPKERLLTSTYLDDPVMLAESERLQSS
jgi:hypothetical protein